MYLGNWKEEIAKHSPAGSVPVLVMDDGMTEPFSIWDSMAIMEYVLELSPESAVGWPDDVRARAYARSVCFELHSGFLAIRNEMSQNLRARRTVIDLNSLSASSRKQISRIDEIWKTCFEKYGGPWLFGDRITIADIVFCPVALRFVTYGIAVSQESQRFIAAIQANPFVQEFIKAAEQETESIDFIDNLVPEG
jgi:glutathione S-transferase